MRIGSKELGDECYVIAEIGHNHGGDLEVAKDMIYVAAKCGADAVKFQKRDNRELFTKEAYDRPYENRNSYGATYGEHREALEFGWDEYVELKRRADFLDIDFFATPFDFESADFLMELGVPAFKIASGDLTNTPFLEHVAAFGKPMIISTGGASALIDVRRAHATVFGINEQICLLQCTASYPAEFCELNLRVIETYREEFECVVGLSSHDNGIAMAVAAYVLGARVIEKHFTLNHTMKGTDHAFSLEPIGFKKMVRDLRRVEVALGDGVKRVYDLEVEPIRKMSKSLVYARDLPEGHVLTRDDIAIKSPGGGIPPYMLDSAVGAKLMTPGRKDEFCLI